MICKYNLQVIPSVELIDYLEFDEAIQVFVFPQISDSLKLSGPTETTYPIEIVFIVSNQAGAHVLTKQRTFNLTIKNPCIDPTNLTVVTPVDMPS